MSEGKVIQIVPYPIFSVKTVSYIEISIQSISLFKSADIMVKMFDINRNLVDIKFLKLEGDAYLQWPESDEYIINWVNSNLGFSMINYNEPEPSPVLVPELTEPVFVPPQVIIDTPPAPTEPVINNIYPPLETTTTTTDTTTTTTDTTTTTTDTTTTETTPPPVDTTTTTTDTTTTTTETTTTTTDTTTTTTDTTTTETTPPPVDTTTTTTDTTTTTTDTTTTTTETTTPP